jgi:uncharacterized protein YciI
MWYAIISEDVEKSLFRRIGARDAHLKRLNDLVEDGRLLIAGPHPAIDASDPGDAGFSGSLVVVDFPSLSEAKAWADDDPYVAAGVYRSVIVKPFKKVLP